MVPVHSVHSNILDGINYIIFILFRSPLTLCSKCLQRVPWRFLLPAPYLSGHRLPEAGLFFVNEDCSASPPGKSLCKIRIIQRRLIFQLKRKSKIVLYVRIGQIRNLPLVIRVAKAIIKKNLRSIFSVYFSYQRLSSSMPSLCRSITTSTDGFSSKTFST